MERHFEASEINKETIESLLGLPKHLVKGIFVYGSRALGSATPSSGEGHNLGKIQAMVHIALLFCSCSQILFFLDFLFQIGTFTL